VGGIIFDLDDTIYPRAQYVESGFNAIASYVASSWRRERDVVLTALASGRARGREGQEFQLLCEECRLPMSLVPALVSLFRGHTPALSLDPPVRCTLERLRRDGWRLVVLTNGDPAVQRRKVAALGIEPLVHAVVYAKEHAPQGKPDPAAFSVALQRLRLAPSRCLCVGDDVQRDIEGARRAGLRSIRVDRQRTRPIVEHDADAVVDSIVKVPAIASSLLRDMTTDVG
jgi:HAD superfamily hydrolase (TIGR01509 family)